MTQEHQSVVFPSLIHLPEKCCAGVQIIFNPLYVTPSHQSNSSTFEMPRSSNQSRTRSGTKNLVLGFLESVKIVLFVEMVVMIMRDENNVYRRKFIYGNARIGNTRFTGPRDRPYLIAPHRIGEDVDAFKLDETR